VQGVPRRIGRRGAPGAGHVDFPFGAPQPVLPRTVRGRRCPRSRATTAWSSSRTRYPSVDVNHSYSIQGVGVGVGRRRERARSADAVPRALLQAIRYGSAAPLGQRVFAAALQCDEMKEEFMKRLVVLALELSGLSLVAACGGSGDSPPANPPPVSVTVSLQPASLAAIDGGQATPVTASVSGDTGGKGVSWRVTCPVGVASCGSMAQATSASGTRDNFQADPAASTAVSVTITATSVLDPTTSKSVPVTVNPVLRSAGAPDLQTAVVGLPFTLSVPSFLQGGTPPISCAVASGTLPANLSWDATTSTLQGIPVAAVPPAVIAFSCKDSASTPASLAPNLQVYIQVLAAPPRAVLKVPRDFHTATLLADGLVLIAGGVTGPNTVGANLHSTATAELYDPATNASKRIGDMTTARVRHTATVLATGPKAGQVLIAGGDLPGTAELFDPGTGKFTAIGGIVRRFGHTATLLANGMVLLAGGSTILRPARSPTPAACVRLERHTLRRCWVTAGC
jgi:hypothetical protein